MNPTDEGERLPASIAGIVRFALRTLAAHAQLYGGLALGVFVAYAVAEYVIPVAALESPLGQFKVYVLEYTGLFADALVIAAAALGVAARASGVDASSRALLGGAVDRWLPVIAVSVLAELLKAMTYALSGLGGLNGLMPAAEPRALIVLTALPTWLFWAILGLSRPFVALSADRGAFFVIAAFGRAFEVALQRRNLVRLAVLAVITLIPDLVESLLERTLIQAHVPRALFWANAPIDALTFAPLAALQAAFALDFVRRAARQRSA